MSVANNVFSAFSFITLILVLIPFPWHLEAWNTGTCLYMLWTALGLLSYFINSIIWRDNAINWAPVWCDITSKLIVGLSVAIPSASLCINHRLYCIASVRSVTRTKQEKYRAIMVDLSIGLGLPIIAMILQYIVQGHRFDIFEEIGCYPFTYNTPPAYLLVWMLPIPIGLTSGAYSVMSIIAFRKRHAEFKEILSSNSNLSSNRFFRLMALAGIEVMCCIPLAITTIVLNSTRGEVRPWISWEDTHWGFSRVDQIPSLLWRSSRMTNVSLEFSRWLVIVCGLIFFSFFGFAEEAQKHYKLAFASVAKHVGYTTSGTTKIGSGITSSTGFQKFKGSFKGTSSGAVTSRGAGMPIIINQEVVEKRDSMDSFSDMTSIKESEYDAAELPPSGSPFNTLKSVERNDSSRAADDAPRPITPYGSSTADISNKV